MGGFDRLQILKNYCFGHTRNQLKTWNVWCPIFIAPRIIEPWVHLPSSAVKPACNSPRSPWQTLRMHAIGYTRSRSRPRTRKKGVPGHSERCLTERSEHEYLKTSDGNRDDPIPLVHVPEALVGLGADGSFCPPPSAIWTRRFLPSVRLQPSSVALCDPRLPGASVSLICATAHRWRGRVIDSSERPMICRRYVSKPCVSTKLSQASVGPTRYCIFIHSRSAIEGRGQVHAVLTGTGLVMEKLYCYWTYIFQLRAHRSSHKPNFLQRL
jgi:hypothetical protein